MLSNNRDWDRYTLEKLDSEGNEVWAKQYAAWGKKLAVDKEGNAYVISMAYMNIGRSYITIKYDREGNQIWEQQHNATSDDVFNPSMAIDEAGNVYVAGSIGYGSMIGSTRIDFLTVKYDREGNKKWAKQYNGGRDEETRSIAVDKLGNVYVTGLRWDMYMSNENSNTQEDIITVKYDSKGEEKWVQSTTEGAFPMAILVSELTSVYVTGVSKHTTTTKYDFITIKYSQQIPNELPQILSIQGPSSPTLLGSLSSINLNYKDDNPSRAIIDWGDNTSTTITTFTSNQIEASHSYATAGVYVVSLTLTDAYGETVKQTYKYLVVYDPKAGFVTGAGWIISPLNPKYPYMQVAGKAHFEFVSKYKIGSSMVDGKTTFQFKAGNLDFKSSSYESMRLVITGSKANYIGRGTINGKGNYGFLISIIDGGITGRNGQDKVRIKIWDRNKENVVVYDTNLSNTQDHHDPAIALTSGSIVIHQGKSHARMDNVAQEKPLVNVFLYPNPVLNKAVIELNTLSADKTKTVLTDAMGRLLFENAHKVMGSSTLEVDLSAFKSGMYFLRIEHQGTFIIVKVVKK